MKNKKPVRIVFASDDTVPGGSHADTRRCTSKR